MNNTIFKIGTKFVWKFKKQAFICKNLKIMAVQTIEKAALDAYFDQMLVEKRAYFKELIKEVIDEKAPVTQQNVVSESFDAQKHEEDRVLKNINAIMLKHDNLLKRLAQ